LSEVELFRIYRAQRASVYVNDSLTIDFVHAREDVPINHYCFSVNDTEFDAILARIKEAGLKYWSAPVGEPDYKVRTFMGGKGLYFMEPDGHAWEILTVSYARPR
jgi:catechol 2,3-dioxygenase-like lactoylglutathione lyase family enzyme